MSRASTPSGADIADDDTFDLAGDTEPPPCPQDGPGRADGLDVPEWLRSPPLARPAGVDAATTAMYAAAVAAGIEHHTARDLAGNTCAILATDHAMGLPVDPGAVALEATRRRRMPDDLAAALAAAWIKIFPNTP